MAATNNNTGEGKRYFYNISYGKLSTKVQSPPENFTEIAEADLKSKTQNVEQVDLRNKYLDKGTGEYRYVVYYDSLTGTITAQEKEENDNGVFLKLTVNDNDGDTSVVQVKLYSKYAENLLNRLLNAPKGTDLTLSPYAVPNTSEIDGRNVSFYTQGVMVRANGEKVEPKYKNDDPKLPKTAQVKVSGKMTTSRDERVDFLYEEFVQNFEIGAPKPSKPKPHITEVQKTKVDPKKSFVRPTVEDDGLPF